MEQTGGLEGAQAKTNRAKESCSSERARGWPAKSRGSSSGAGGLVCHTSVPCGEAVREYTRGRGGSQLASSAHKMVVEEVLRPLLGDVDCLIRLQEDRVHNIKQWHEVIVGQRHPAAAAVGCWTRVSAPPQPRHLQQPAPAGLGCILEPVHKCPQVLRLPALRGAGGVHKCHKAAKP